MITYSKELKILVQNILLKYPDLLSFIREEKYRPSDTGLTYRQVNSLDQSGLLYERRNSEKEWRVFNLNDILYLHVISQAKLFNSEHSRLEILKKTFYEQIINYTKIGEVTFSEIALVALLTEFVPIGILLFNDGDVVLTDDPSTPFLNGFTDAKKRTFVFTMLYETFNPYIKKIKASEDFKKFDLVLFEDDYSVKAISRQQRTLLKIVEDNEYTQITITKKKGEGLLVIGEKKLDGVKLTPEDLLEVFEKQEFGNINAYKRNGEVESLRLNDVYKI